MKSLTTLLLQYKKKEQKLNYILLSIQHDIQIIEKQNNSMSTKLAKTCNETTINRLCVYFHEIQNDLQKVQECIEKLSIHQTKQDWSHYLCKGYDCRHPYFVNNFDKFVKD